MLDIVFFLTSILEKQSNSTLPPVVCINHISQHCYLFFNQFTQWQNNRRKSQFPVTGLRAEVFIPLEPNCLGPYSIMLWEQEPKLFQWINRGDSKWHYSHSHPLAPGTLNPGYRRKCTIYQTLDQIYLSMFCILCLEVLSHPI